jgi:PhnB protein
MENFDPAKMPHPDPATVGGVIPYLAMGGRANAAADFYAKAFGATDVFRLPLEKATDKLLHCHIVINGGSLMMTDHGYDQDPPPPPPTSVTMQLVVDDGDWWFARAVAAGCIVEMPLTPMFWGARFGRLVDPFGIAWAFNAPQMDGAGP